MQTVNTMFKLSESRGKEASGLAIRFNRSIYVLKEPITSSKLVKTQQYKNLFNKTLKSQGYAGNTINGSICYFGSFTSPNKRYQRNKHEQSTSRQRRGYRNPQWNNR